MNMLTCSFPSNMFIFYLFIKFMLHWHPFLCHTCLWGLQSESSKKSIFIFWYLLLPSLACSLRIAWRSHIQLLIRSSIWADKVRQATWYCKMHRLGKFCTNVCLMKICTQMHINFYLKVMATGMEFKIKSEKLKKIQICSIYISRL